MSNMIVPENKIKARFYNLVIDGDIVEEMLTPRMANILRNEYRAEGFAVDKVEVWTVLNSGEIIDEIEPRLSDEDLEPKRQFLTPAATQAKINRDREVMRLRNSRKASQRNRMTNSEHYTSYGAEKNSLLHQDYLKALRKNGFRVINLVTDEVWIGFQKEIAEEIFNYLKNGGDKANLDIKLLGKK